MNLTKPFNSGLQKWMCKAARPLGGMDSLNPRCWRDKRLHHHGGGVCWLFVLLWMDLWRHELIACKIWYKNNLKMRLTALLFDPPTRAPYHLTDWRFCLFLVWINSTWRHFNDFPLNGVSSTIDFNDKPDDLSQCFNNSIQTSNNDTNTNPSNQYEMRRDALK